MAHFASSSDSGFIAGSASGSSGCIQPRIAAQRKDLDEVVFVHDVDKWKCPLCIKILLIPVQTLCGHRFCDACITEYIKQNGDPSKCPVGESDCEMVSVNEKTLFKDASARREILNLIVRCKFYCFGCTEKIEWRTYDNHIRKCNFKRWPCKYQDNGCPEMLKEEHFENHVKICKYQPKRCSICKQMDDHEDGCENKIFVCLYHTVGCNFNGTMSELEGHSKLFMPQHLEMSVTCLEKMLKEKSSLMIQVNDLTKQQHVSKKKIEHLEKENKVMNEKMRKMELKMTKQNESLQEMETRVSGLSDAMNTQQIELNTLQSSGIIQRAGQDNSNNSGKIQLVTFYVLVI